MYDPLPVGRQGFEGIGREARGKGQEARGEGGATSGDGERRDVVMILVR